MIPERLDCDCGHRLALHTYFKDRSPCTLCHCSTFVRPVADPVPFRRRSPEDGIAARRRESDRSRRYQV